MEAFLLRFCGHPETFTFHQQQDPLATRQRVPRRRQNDLDVAPVDAAAAAVHLAKPEVEGAVPVYQLHLHVAPLLLRWVLARKPLGVGDVSVPQQIECHDGRGHIGAGDQDVPSNGDADRRQFV